MRVRQSLSSLQDVIKEVEILAFYWQFLDSIEIMKRDKKNDKEAKQPIKFLTKKTFFFTLCKLPNNKYLLT